MPGKSRHGKGKHYSKKSKVLRRQGASPAMPQATASIPEIPKQAISVATPLVKATAASAKTANLYPYITSELRRIAILAGIIIIILIVLAIILS